MTHFDPSEPASQPAAGIGVSVVIPGYLAERTLPACLEALRAPRLRERIREVVFVDDHGPDQSAEIARAFGVVVLSTVGKGAGAARNTGARAAGSDWLWFVDADCVPEPDALERLLECAARTNSDAVGGSYSNLAPESLVACLIHDEMVVRHQRLGARVSFAITANLLCRRSSLLTLGGFDESLLLAQDLDFAYRLVESGGALAFEPTSRVGHFHETSFARYLKKQLRQGYWRMFLYRKHPAKVRGDEYSGLLDYAQPVVAIAGLFGVVAGFFVSPSAAALVASAALCSLVLLNLPMALRIGRSGAKKSAVLYPAFGAARALARGLGMSAGLLPRR